MGPRAELQTARLTLRPPRLADAGWIAAEIAVPAVHSRLTSPPRPYGLADAEHFLTTIAAAPGHYVIEADEPLGVISLTSELRGPELGYWLRTGAWGQGFMTEAARAVVAEWFLNGASELVSGHLTGNEGSANVLGKLGFRYTGIARHHSSYFGHDVDVHRMVLTPDAFRAALPWAAQSDRLSYRPLLAIDRDALHEIVCHQSVTRQLGPKWPWPADPDFTLTRTFYRGAGFVWGIFYEARLIGTVGVTEGELGYALHPDHHGQGFAHEACLTALTRAFGPLGLDEVEASAWSDNHASLGLLAKLGFAVTGHDLGTSACRPDPAPGTQLVLSKAGFHGAAKLQPGGRGV